MGAIHSFFRYAQSEDPSNIINCQRILHIPRGKSSKPIIKYLTVSDTKLLLSQPDTATIKGRRDMVILSLLYDTGARVQELIVLSVRDIRLEHPVSVSFGANENIKRTTTIRSLYGIDMRASNVVGLVGSPMSIETSSEFEQATITFNYNEDELGDVSVKLLSDM